MVVFFIPASTSGKEIIMIKTCLDNVREKTPLVHNITNYVTVNDVANVLLASGGSPIMSDEPEDVEDITSICGGLNINIGTLNKSSIEGMFRAGKKANELGHMVLLDPVGAGASKLRTDTATKLMEEVKFDVIRGNIFHTPSIVVDTHVGRISRKLGLTKETDPKKVEYDLMRVLPEENWIRYNIQVISFGREICKAPRAKCADCFLTDLCPSFQTPAAPGKS